MLKRGSRRTSPRAPTSRCITSRGRRGPAVPSSASTGSATLAEHTARRTAGPVEDERRGCPTPPRNAQVRTSSLRPLTRSRRMECPQGVTSARSPMLRRGGPNRRVARCSRCSDPTPQRRLVTGVRFERVLSRAVAMLGANSRRLSMRAITVGRVSWRAEEPTNGRPATPA